MKITREQSEVLLMEYASGALDEACALLVASYVTLCPDARRYLRSCEDMGGAMMEHCCKPVAMDGGSMNKVLERLEEDCPEASPCPDKTAFCLQNALPSPIAAYIDSCNRRAEWRRVGRGIQYCHLPVEGSRYKMALMKLSPSRNTPRHKHTGMEITLVLDGSYSDEYGTYRTGDLIITEGVHAHRPRANDKGCLCLTVIDGPLRFSSPFGLFLGLLAR